MCVCVCVRARAYVCVCLCHDTYFSSMTKHENKA